MKPNKQSILLTLTLSALLLLFGACGDGEDDSTSVVINNPDAPQEEEVPPTAGTTINISNTVRVNNRVENNVRVSSNSRVQNNNLLFFWSVQNADSVLHQQWIHRSDRCPTVINDFNRDNFIDEQELEQTVGPRVLGLQLQTTFPTGNAYTYTRVLTLQELWEVVAPGERFVVIWYGIDPSFVLPQTYVTLTPGVPQSNVSIACRVFRSPRAPGPTTTGGTSGPI